MHILKLSYISHFFSNFSDALSSASPLSKAIFFSTVTGLGLTLGKFRIRQIEEEQADHEEFLKIKNKICRTYFYVFGGFTLTTVSGIVSHVSGLSLKILNNPLSFLPLSIACLGSLIATTNIPQKDGKIKHIAWAIFPISTGMMFSFLGFIRKGLIAQAAYISIGLASVLTLTSFYATSKTFLKVKGPLIAALSTLSIASAAAIFFPGNAFANLVNQASLYGGLVIFSLFLMYHTRKTLEEAKGEEFDPIKSSIDLYQTGISIFLRILSVLLERDQKTHRAYLDK
jgi:growth hormone-inducible transmembrane protein